MSAITRMMIMATAFLTAACAGKTAQSTQAASPQTAVPTFCADSAYRFVETQTVFGPRVPGSEASRQCAQWLVSQLRQYGATDITQQRAQVNAYNGDVLDINNISASFNPDAPKRVLLLSHWDSRPWADQEEDPAKRNQPIDGANDGASGVGVILEIARQASLKQPKVGLDILFVDAEDYGRRADLPDEEADEQTWCLGSQYWAQEPTLDTSKIEYAVLLDMVGGKDAVFPKEYFSEYYHRDINDKVWKAADKAGYASRFPTSVGAPVVDDHIYLNLAGIRAIDIIETAVDGVHAFNPTWHTHSDNIDNIDPATLQAVGQTLMQLLY